MKDVIYQKKEKMKNINRVYQFISQNKFFTKKEIADSLDISFPTVAKIINLLLDKKIVIDKGYSDNKQVFMNIILILFILLVLK